MPDPHEILGVPQGASPRAIRQAFLRQAKRQHPDMAGSDAQMARLNQAYASLRVQASPSSPGGPSARLHRAPRRPRPPVRALPLTAEASRFVETTLLPFDRLIGLAVEGLLMALDGRAAEPAAALGSRARLTLEATGARLARADWPPGLEAVRGRYGEGLRQISDALEDLQAGEEARTGLISGLARLRSASRVAASGEG